MINVRTGLTREEQWVMDNLVDAVNGYAKLPIEHPHEVDEFLHCIHRLQDMMAIRVVRRSFPGGWYKVSSEKTKLGGS